MPWEPWMADTIKKLEPIYEDLENKYIHPITLKAALEVASNLRSEDFREISEGHGLDPLTYLAANVYRSLYSLFYVA